MSSKASFSLGRAVSSAVSALPASLGGAWGALAVLWLVATFGHTIVEHSPVSAWLLPVFLILLVVAKLMAQGALYRIALFGKDAKAEGLGIGGLQFGAPELRLLVAGIFVSLFMLMVIAAVFIVFAVAFNTAGMANGHENTLKAVKAMLSAPTPAGWAFVVYMVAAGIFFIFVALKFVLAHAATVAERRIVTLNALGLSAGNVGKLFLGACLFVLPAVVLVVAVVHFILPHGHRVADDGHDPLRLIVHAALQAVAVFIIAPLLTGFLSSAYRQIVQTRAK